MIRTVSAVALLAVALGLGSDGAASAAPACGKACLEGMATRYRKAYLAHDPKLAPFAANVRFTENNVELKLPDGTWDTVSREIGPALTISDPSTGNVGIYTLVMQNDVAGFLSIRLRVAGGQITEVEHVVSTKRNLYSPPTPMGDPKAYAHDPDLARAVTPAERTSRAEMIRVADAYFSTLENNNGEYRGAKFAPGAARIQNGLTMTGIARNFEVGRHRYNDRVRDRDYVMVDEARGLVMARAYIDHKGVLDRYTLKDGTEARSEYREPQTWGMLEIIKVKKGEITAIEANFVQTPYYMRSPWRARPEMRAGGLTPPAPRPPASAPAPTNPPLD